MIHTHDTGQYNSAYGIDAPTEALKQFSQEAFVGQNVFCVSPTCSPSRGAMMTGQYPHNNGLVGLAHRGFSLDRPTEHLACFLQRNGYMTVLAGIQHEEQFWFPKEVAYKSAQHLGYELNITSYDGEINDGNAYMDWDEQNAKNIEAFIRNYSHEQPFFLSYGLFSTHRQYPDINQCKSAANQNVHIPHTLHSNETTRRDTQKLHESLYRFDENFSRVIRALKEKGIYEETIILYTTDHGLANPFAKGNLNDAGTKVSFVLRSPQHKKTHGIISDALISQIDWFPTLCDILQLEPPDYLEGKSFYELLSSPKKTHRKEVFCEQNFHTSYEPVRSIRTQRYRLIKFLDTNWKKYNLSNCDESDAKSLLIESGWQDHNKEQMQLYDLYFDPYEKNNLYGKKRYEKIAKELEQQLHEWQIISKDKMWDKQEYVGKYKVNKKQCIYPSIRSIEDIER